MAFQSCFAESGAKVLGWAAACLHVPGQEVLFMCEAAIEWIMPEHFFAQLMVTVLETCISDNQLLGVSVCNAFYECSALQFRCPEMRNGCKHDA